MEQMPKIEHRSNRLEDLIDMKQHFAAVEQFKSLENYWIGQDVSLAEKLTIPPLRMSPEINVMVNKNDFPNIDINRDSLSFLNWSVRSCLAQSGVEVIFNSLSLTDEMLKDINEGKGVPIPVAVFNNIDRPVELDGNIIRFFYARDNNRLRDDELRGAINNKDIVIEGEEGVDWLLENRKGEDGKDRYLCLTLPLREKFYIPKSSEVLKVNSKNDLPDVLKEIPNGRNPEFTIGETAKVKLGSNIMAVINTGGYPDGSSHGHSCLIDPNFEGNIRTETMYGLNAIELLVYKK